jgi:hypothetical protein
MGWGALLAIGGAAIGCGSADEIACAPVRGQVLLGGKPLAEAMVVFHPLDQPPLKAPQPVAYSDGDGRFALTTLKTGDGAPAGRYAVTIELRAARLVGEELVRDGRNLLPPQYGNPQRSPLKCVVVVGDNEIPPINIEQR